MKSLLFFTAFLITELTLTSGSNTPENPCPNEDDSALSKFEVAQADFALRFLRLGAKEQKSAISSPLSASVILAIAYAGAKGNTKTQIGDVFSKGASDVEILNYFSNVTSDLARPSNEYELNLANKLYISQNFELVKAYERIIKKEFDGQLEEIDFSQPQQAARLINQWVEGQTNSKIKDLVSANSIDPIETALIGINAVYFKGQWKTSFNESLTYKGDFFVNKNLQKKVDMMKMNAEKPYAEDRDLKIKILELPYGNSSDLSMRIVLPDERFGLPDVLAQLTGEKLFKLIKRSHEFGDTEVNIALPKFKIESEFELAEALPKMGVVDAFVDGLADFSGIIDSSTLSISQMVQKAFVEVTEQGTEAAAATSFVLSNRFGGGDPANFIADHPFLFAIMKKQLILFIGQVY